MPFHFLKRRIQINFFLLALKQRFQIFLSKITHIFYFISMELLTWFQASATLNCLLLFIAEFLLPKSFFRHLKFVNKMKKN